MAPNAVRAVTVIINWRIGLSLDIFGDETIVDYINFTLKMYFYDIKMSIRINP